MMMEIKGPLAILATHLLQMPLIYRFLDSFQDPLRKKHTISKATHIYLQFDICTYRSLTTYCNMSRSLIIHLQGRYLLWKIHLYCFLSSATTMQLDGSPWCKIKWSIDHNIFPLNRGSQQQLLAVLFALVSWQNYDIC